MSIYKDCPHFSHVRCILAHAMRSVGKTNKVGMRGEWPILGPNLEFKMTKEPLVCDFAMARIGCKMIADHILELAEASHTVLDLATKEKEAKSTLRSAYILNLIGYEEAGKLFMIWQALADAERRSLDKVRIEEFEYHDPKGDLAGDLCCQMLDFLEGDIMEIIESIKSAGSGMTPEEEIMITRILAVFKSSVSVHKERVYRIRKRFKQEREDAMYIDFRNGGWILSPQLSSEMLAMDCILLKVVAKAANAYLLEELPFSLATKALSDMSKNVKSDEADRFLSALKKRDPKWFNFPNREEH